MFRRNGPSPGEKMLRRTPTPLQKSSKNDTGLAVHRTTMQHILNKKENTEKPEASWNSVLWTDKTKVFGHH